MGSKVQLPTRIDSFKDPWGFLSNFYPAVVTLDGVEYPSVEHAYQAAKTLNPKKREKFTYPGMTPAQAKSAGYAIKPLRENWDEIKLGIMEELLRQKFAGSILQRKLLSTFQAELVEGNWWHDTFYGVCDGSGRHYRCPGHEPYGENHLGKLLMKIRSEIVNRPRPVVEAKPIEPRKPEEPPQGLLF